MIEFCSATTKRGTDCQFSARKESGLCVNHDPDYREQQRANVMKGVQKSLASRKRPETRPDAIDLSTRAGVQAAIDAFIRMELRGDLPIARSRHLIRALAVASRNFDPPPKRDLWKGARSDHSDTYYHARQSIMAIVRKTAADPSLAAYPDLTFDKVAELLGLTTAQIVEAQANAAGYVPTDPRTLYTPEELWPWHPDPLDSPIEPTAAEPSSPFDPELNPQDFSRDAVG